jgi:hypothetical protein
LATVFKLLPKMSLPKVKNVVVIGMFLDMVNVVDNTFEFPLLQNKFIVSFHWF